MTYDKKFDTTSFREALSKCLNTASDKSLEELHKMPRGAKIEETPQQLDEDQADTVELSEDELLAEIEAELAPHIVKLIEEGFEDEEIEEIILEMLADDEEEIEEEKKNR